MPDEGSHCKLQNYMINDLQKTALAEGLPKDLLKNYNHICKYYNDPDNHNRIKQKCLLVCLVIFIISVLSASFINNVLSMRCLVSNNYLIWEATRPLADCSYCVDVSKPIILKNVTQKNFQKYAYSSKPIIIKNAISHWKALKTFNFHMFKTLYEETSGSYDSLEDGCQFLNFKTDLFSLKDVFNMPEERVRNEPGQKPWYVGWGNCHPDILAKVRKYYSVPEFLPEDAEFPATENIFFGYEFGAVMHLDYIPRLMWQGQLKGNKTWHIAPVPECDDVCHTFEYYVEPGDVVLLDTRLWYHATRIAKGEFSITVQSEYG